MISHEKKLIFVHIPKTGGKTFSKFFRPYCDEESLRFSPYNHGPNKDQTGDLHTVLHNYYEWYGAKNIGGYKVVTICRNPWDKVLSTYMEETRKDPDPFTFDREKFKHLIHKPQEFHREQHSHLFFWQRIRIGDLTPIANQGLFNRSNETLEVFLRANWFCDPEFKLSFENYAADVGEFFDRYGIRHNKQELSIKTNTSKHDHYSLYYDDDDRDYIGYICDLDCYPGVCHPDGYTFVDRRPSEIQKALSDPEGT